MKSDEYEHKRAYIFGDVKTCDNIDKIKNDINNCEANTTFDEAAPLVVEAALNKLIVIPGD